MFWGPGRPPWPLESHLKAFRGSKSSTSRSLGKNQGCDYFGPSECPPHNQSAAWRMQPIPARSRGIEAHWGPEACHGLDRGSPRATSCPLALWRPLFWLKGMRIGGTVFQKFLSFLLFIPVAIGLFPMMFNTFLKLLGEVVCSLSLCVWEGGYVSSSTLITLSSLLLFLSFYLIPGKLWKFWICVWDW